MDGNTNAVTKALEQLRVHLNAAVDLHQKNDLLLRLIDLSRAIPSIDSVAPTLTVPIFKCLRTLCADREQAIRSQALRALRYLVNDEAAVELLSRLGFDILIVRSVANLLTRILTCVCGQGHWSEIKSTYGNACKHSS